jgi:NADH-quinone oxidoreductase subunit K
MVSAVEIIGIEKFILLSSIIFTIGLSSIFINRKNIIAILMSIELMLLAVNINFIAFSAQINDLTGQIFAIFILTVAGAEAAIGLAILLIYFSNNQNIDTNSLNRMKG